LEGSTLNRSDAIGVPTAGGFHGKFRPCWKAAYETVLGKDAKGNFAGPEIFTTQAEAEAAAWRTLRDLEEPVMVRSGPMLNAVRAHAEAMFKVREAVE
jgi:hypothetical protein